MPRVRVQGHSHSHSQSQSQGCGLDQGEGLGLRYRAGVTEPRSDSCTTRSRPERMAKMQTIISVALPKVALSSPPTVAFVCSASWDGVGVGVGLRLRVGARVGLRAKAR